MKLLPYICFFLFLVACKNDNLEEHNELVNLVFSGESIKLPLDENTKTTISTFFVFDSYFIFQNEQTNEILLYDKKTAQLVKKVQFQEEGSNGVGRFIGFFPLNVNEFILTQPGLCELTIVDDQALVKRRIRYDQNENGDQLIPCVSATGDIGPIVLIDDKLFLGQMMNPFFGEERLEKSPVSIMIDTVTHEITTLPLRYPPVISLERMINRQAYGNEFNVYRCFNGKQFVYSFSFDEHLHIASPSHDSILKIKAKSKYIEKLQPIKPGISDFKLALKRMAEVAMYRNLLYDPYREVYYRFVYLENELDANESFLDQLRYGHSLFSVLILDNNFKIIGETLFPEFIYNPTLAFIDEDGFYISDSHYKNPDYNEDVLSFRKFILQDIN